MFIFYFVMGSCLASFIGVVVERYPKNESFIFGRSHCCQCDQILKSYEMIPIISYFMLKGKCHYCHAKIPLKLVLLELLGGCLGVYCYLQFQNLDRLLVLMMILILLAISMIDWKMMVIPDELNLFFFVIALIYMTYHHDSLQDILLGMISVSLPMFILALLIPYSFGGGDIKLMFESGMILGWTDNLIAFLIGILLAAVYALYQIKKGKLNVQAHIAFAPFLSIGIILMLVYGQQITTTYLRLLI